MHRDSYHDQRAIACTKLFDPIMRMFRWHLRLKFLILKIQQTENVEQYPFLCLNRFPYFIACGSDITCNNF